MANLKGWRITVVFLGVLLGLYPSAARAQQPAAEDGPVAGALGATASVDDGRGGHIGYLGGKPWGTYTNTLRHADVAFVMAHSPRTGDGWLTGVSYAERGGTIGQLLVSLLAGGEAQSRANREQRAVTYNVPYDSEGRLGLGFELLGRQDAEGLDATAGRADINYIFSTHALTGEQGLPFTFSLGFAMAGSTRSERRPADATHAEAYTVETTRNSYGLSVVTAYPVSRWAQVDLALFGDFNDFAGSDGRLGGTFHLGNRLFLSTAATFVSDGLGLELRTGVRL